MTPAAIDAYVRSQLAAGEDLYTLQAEALAALGPDLILTQDLCRVCALPTGQVEQALDYLGCHAAVVLPGSHTLDDVLASILLVGDRSGTAERARALVAQLPARLDTVAASVAGAPRPAVAVVKWVDPPFTAGHWVPDLTTAAGGIPVTGAPGAPSTQSSWEQITAANADLVLLALWISPRRRSWASRRRSDTSARRAGVGHRRRRAHRPDRPAPGRRRRVDLRHPSPSRIADTPGRSHQRGRLTRGRLQAVHCAVSDGALAGQPFLACARSDGR